MTVARPVTQTMPAFGALLRRYRRAAGLTQEALAERAHISKRTVSDMERGVPHRPRRDTLALLAGALQLTPTERDAFIAAARRLGPMPPEVLALETVPVSPFVGQAHELALLERHLAGAGPPLLVLAGEPGIGKSRLLHAALTRAIDAGYCVLADGCQRQGGQEPYAPLLGALQSHLRRRHPAQLRRELQGCAWLVRLLPELASGPIEPLPAWTLSPEQEQRLMGEAVLRFLGNVAGPAGTLLALDDLQWAGADALALLSRLVRSAAEVPLRIIGAYRDTEVQTGDPLAVTLADLTHAGLAARRALAPLTSAEAAQLLDALLAEAPDAEPALRARVVQRTGGVPFFLLSCAQELRRRERAKSAETVPWDVTQSVRQRVAVLPAQVREVLGVAALVGRVVPYALLAGACNLRADDVAATLAAACEARLLEEAGTDTYQFAHDVIREVVEADLGAARRLLLHGRIGQALEQTGGPRADVEALAYHYSRGAEQDKAILYLERVGDQARAQHAHAAAEGYYRELVERLDSLGRSKEAASVCEKLGAVLHTAARYDAALSVFDQAASTYQDVGDQEGVWRLLAALGHVHVRRGTPEEGLQRLQPVLEALAPADASPGTAALHEALAALCFVSGRYAEQLTASERSLTLAQAVGAERIVVAALYARGGALADLGRRTEALPVLEEASRLAEALGDLDTACEALNMAGCVHEDLGAFAMAQRYTKRALALAEQRGDPASIAYLTVRRGMGAFLSGDWVEAHADYEHALALCRQLGPSDASPYPPLDLGRLCLAEGAWEDAVAFLEESCAIAVRSGDITPLRWAQVELAEHDLLTGHPEAAQARLEPLLDRPGLEEGQVSFLLPPLAQAQLELGEVEQAAALVAQGVQRARAQPNQRALVGALRVQALVLIRQGDWAAAERAVDEGLALARGMPYPYAEARLLHAYGLLHAAQGMPAPARERLEQALAIFNRLGARKDVEAVEQAMERLR